MSYDPRCEELASYFLEEGKPTEAQVKQLSQGIQDYIEDFIHGEDLENESNRRQQEEAREPDYNYTPYEESRSYRESMIDAGRGHLIK